MGSKLFLTAALLAVSAAVLPGAGPGHAAERWRLPASWIWDTWQVMERCGELQWQQRVCKVKGGLTDADRRAVAARWLRQGFPRYNVNEIISRWKERVALRLEEGDVNIDGFNLAAPPQPYVRLTSPEACRAARDPATAAPVTAACRNAQILCFGIPCDLNRLPHRLPGEVLVVNGMNIADCGYGQWVDERCGIKGGVDAALRKRAFDRLRREGFDPEDVAALEDYWQDHYDQKKHDGLAPNECAEARKPATIADWVKTCGVIHVDCQPYGNCARYKPRRGRR